MNGTALLITIIIGLGVYFFSCYVQFKICKKFGIGSLFECCIPIYNIVLLCQCAEISGWNVLWVILPSLVFTGDASLIAAIVNIVFAVVLWGRIAEKMGRGFWQYGLGTAFLLGIPALVLAFGTAHPGISGAFNDSLPAFPDEPIYRPLPSGSHMNDPGMTIPVNHPSSGSFAKLYCTYGEFKGNQIDLPTEGITIGRDPSACQIVITSKEASRSHTKIIPIEDSRGVILNDLNSTNGTYYQLYNGGSDGQWKKVNGPVSLGPGSHFKVGKDLAVFRII